MLSGQAILLLGGLGALLIIVFALALTQPSQQKQKRSSPTFIHQPHSTIQIRIKHVAIAAVTALTAT